ncbi:MAG TPA: anthranilate synthase component I family protein [Pyrinomonadaceae bacterium]|nr:anthranilate synthase component I family protein [Pyrinomonadaceae bacterium]
MTVVTPSSFEEFEHAAALGNVVPVVRTVVSDFQQPVDAFERLGASPTYSFLFESIEGGESLARHSFIGIEPELIVRGRGNQTIVERAGAIETLEVSAPEFISEYFRTRTLSPVDGLPPLAGGAIGYLGFQATQWFESAFENKVDSVGDDAVWMFFKTVVAIERGSQTTQIVSIVFTEEAGADRSLLKTLYEQAIENTARFDRALKKEIPDEKIPTTNANVKRTNDAAAFVSNWDRESFEGAVRTIKEHIFAGDCYQVVISQCFKRKTSAEALAIYRALRATNPSPYMFFLRLGEGAILGASPEMLVRCRGRQLDYRPIAGTRPRGDTEAEDARLGNELRADEKEVAEHVMLVDLGRNDLGRVADFGSVKVESLMTIERYSHVQHLVSSLTAQLRDGLDRFDALAACFPAGTVTGAPKVRAMEIIQGLEPTPRDVYSGAILYADYAGNLDSCIAIRTLVLDRDGMASVQAGAGIVADSIPELEYEETVNKARALFRAIEIAEESSTREQTQAVKSTSFSLPT